MFIRSLNMKNPFDNSSLSRPRSKQLLSAILLCLFAETALSLPADLDTGFNTTGFLLDNYTLDSASGRQNRPVLPIINPDGSFQIFGDSQAIGTLVTPLLADFASNGTRNQVVTLPGFRATAAVQTAQGDIVLGFASQSVAGINAPGYLKKISRDGTPDTNFGSGGTFSDTGMLFTGAEMTLGIDSQNRILVTSFSKGLMRFTENGALDTSFGINGIAQLPADRGQFESFFAQAQATDGAIYLLTGGSGGDANSVLRITAQGNLDTSFGTNGRKVLLANSSLHTIAAMPNGGVLVLEGCKQGNPTCRLSHFDNTGASVATAAVKELPAGVTQQARLTRGGILKRLPDGRILLSADWVGTLAAPPWFASGQLFGLFNADLSPVTEFDGDNGLIVHNPGFEFNTPMPSTNALDVTSDGRIMYVGEALDSSFNPRWAAMRLQGQLPTTPPVNEAPVVEISGGNLIIVDTDAAPGESVSLSATASDSDGTIVSTEWLVGGQVAGSGLSINLLLPDGDTLVTFRATDNLGAISTASVTVTVLPPPATPPSIWPWAFNGVEPDPELGLELNNIGLFYADDGLIYSCLNIQTNQLPDTLDGVAQFDIAFEILSPLDEDGIVRVVKTRIFNETDAQTVSGEPPSCSGVFETTTGIYTDIIQIEGDTFALSFTLFDGDNLELQLMEMLQLLPDPFDGWPAAFSGVAPNPSLQLDFNNIGVYDPVDNVIYSCLSFQTNQQPVTLDGLGRFDIAFKILPMDVITIQVEKSRPFNEMNMLTDLGEEPSCSGVFETTTNLYVDIVQVGLETFSVTFLLINGDTLELQLQTAVLLE